MSEAQRVSCTEAFERLDAYLDRTLSSREHQEVESHLEACTHCSCEYRYEETFIREVRAKLKRLQAPPELMRKIHARLGSLDS